MITAQPLLVRLTFLFVFACLASQVSKPQQINRGQEEMLRAGFASAQKLERAGNWAAAEAEWRRLLELAPKDARIWTNLGVVLSKQQRDADALAAWNQAANLDPKMAGPFFNIGLTLVRKGDYQPAIKPLRRALAIEPENQAARRALSLALIGTDQFKEASREIAQLLAKSPKDPGLLELAGRNFLRQQRYAEAAMVFARRTGLPDASAAIWAQYGDALDGASRTPEALEAYRKAVALDPGSTLFRYALGYTYWKLYQYEDAERELTEVLRRDKDDARASFTLGDLYLTKGDARRALPFLRQAAAAYPNEFDTRFALGRALVLTGELAQGIVELRAATNINDSIADGHFQLGRALQKAGLNEEARRELERARILHDAKRQSEAERLPKISKP